MSNLPLRKQQIIQVHAALINHVVIACHNRDLLPVLESALQMCVENGRGNLVDSIRLVLSGRRDESIYKGLDDDDRVIMEAILRGLQDPATLPEPEAPSDGSLAAPGLANMVHAAANGNVEALQLIAQMAAQMSKVGGDMARLAAIIRPLINGERDADRLCHNMSLQGKGLVIAILEELARLNRH